MRLAQVPTGRDGSFCRTTAPTVRSSLVTSTRMFPATGPDCTRLPTSIEETAQESSGVVQPPFGSRTSCRALATSACEGPLPAPPPLPPPPPATTAITMRSAISTAIPPATSALELMPERSRRKTRRGRYRRRMGAGVADSTPNSLRQLSHTNLAGERRLWMSQASSPAGTTLSAIATQATSAPTPRFSRLWERAYSRRRGQRAKHPNQVHQDDVEEHRLGGRRADGHGPPLAARVPDAGDSGRGVPQARCDLLERETRALRRDCHRDDRAGHRPCRPARGRPASAVRPRARRRCPLRATGRRPAARAAAEARARGLDRRSRSARGRGILRPGGASPVRRNQRA